MRDHGMDMGPHAPGTTTDKRQRVAQERGTREGRGTQENREEQEQEQEQQEEQEQEREPDPQSRRSRLRIY